jgi:hypothetical protein
MSSLTSISASPIEQLPGQIRKLVDVGHGQSTLPSAGSSPATCWPKWSSPTEASHLIKNTPHQGAPRRVTTAPQPILNRL